MGPRIPKCGARIHRLDPREPKLGLGWVPRSLVQVLRPLYEVHELWMRLAEKVTQGAKSPNNNNNNNPTLQKTMPLKRLVKTTFNRLYVLLLSASLGRSQLVNKQLCNVLEFSILKT